MTNPRPRGRPRSFEVKDAILQAALKECEQHGYSQLTIEMIAKSAGVSKPTLYRWWSSKAAIVLEALTIAIGNQIPVSDSGDWTEDMQRYLLNTCHVLNSRSGQMIRELIGVAQLDAAFAEQFWNDFLLARRKGLIHILRRAEERGLVPEGHDVEFLADVCYGTIWYRLLNQKGQLDEPLVKALVSMVTDKLKA